MLRSSDESIKIPPMLRMRIRKKKKKRSKKMRKKKKSKFISRASSSSKINKSALYINLMTVLLSLWKKNEDLRSCTMIRIPPTYLIVHSYPVSYMFYDEERQDIILRSEGISLEPERVLSDLHSKEIVKGEIRNVFVHQRPAGEEEKCATLTRPDLIRLLSKHHSLGRNEDHVRGWDGILQSLISPTTVKDRVYVVKWTPNVQKIVLIQQRNNYHLAKSSTISTGCYGSRFSKELSGMVDMTTKNTILRICEHIVRHLASTSQLRVAEMELVFKKDKSKRLWLLRTRNVRISRVSVGKGNTSARSTPRSSSSVISKYTSDQYNIISSRRPRFTGNYLQQNDIQQKIIGKPSNRNNGTNERSFRCFSCGVWKEWAKSHQYFHVQGRDRDMCKNCYWKTSLNQRRYFFKKLERKWSARSLLVKKSPETEKSEHNTTFDTILKCVKQRRIVSGRPKRRSRHNHHSHSQSKRVIQRSRSVSTNSWRSVHVNNNIYDNHHQQLRKQEQQTQRLQSGGVVGTISKKTLVQRRCLPERPRTTNGVMRKRRWSSTRRSRQNSSNHKRIGYHHYRNRSRNIEEQDPKNKKKRPKNQSLSQTLKNVRKRNVKTAIGGRRASMPLDYPKRSFNVKISVKKN